MSKKFISNICAVILMISCCITAIGYAIGNSTTPWWLIVFVGGIACAIVSQIGTITRVKDEEEKHKKILGCICSSISMISVLIFLIVQFITNMENSWLIVFIGGVISGIIYLLDGAKSEMKK